MSATDYLSAIRWGASTGGSAGTAESEATLGTARIDTREPPDQYHVSGLQISRLVELATGMSQFFKSGTRLRVLKQTANPFGVTESGFYISNAGTAYSVVDGVATAMGAGGAGDMVLASIQTNTGAKTFNSATLLATAPVFTGSITGTYSLAGTPTLASNLAAKANLVVTGAASATNTTAMTLISNAADGASSVGFLIEATTAIPAGKVLQVNNGTGAGVFHVLSDFGSTVHAIKGNNNIMQFINSAGAGTSAQANDLYLKTAAGAAVELINASHMGSYTDGAISAGADGKRFSALYLTSFEVVAGIPKWVLAGNAQTTVGASGAASNTPAAPEKYLKVKDSAGTTYVVPAYLAS
jgi:hypothetical protein